jgi:hypothetical protein
MFKISIHDYVSPQALKVGTSAPAQAFHQDDEPATRPVPNFSPGLS